MNAKHPSAPLPTLLILATLWASPTPGIADEVTTANYLKATPKILRYDDVSRIEFQALLAALPPAPRRPLGFEQELEAEAGVEPLVAAEATLDAPVRPSAAEGSAELDQTPAATRSFLSVTNPYYTAADTSIAASKTHLIVTTRNEVVIHTKSGKILAGPFPIYSLLGLVAPPPIDDSYDARVLFDDATGRFFLGTLAFNKEGQVVHPKRRSKFLLAVSKTGDPFDGWFLYSWDAVPGDGTNPPLYGYEPGDCSDYDTMGVGPAYFLQSNPVAKVGQATESIQLTVWNSADLAAGLPNPRGYLFYDVVSSDGAPEILQPAIHHGNETPLPILVGRVGADGLDVWNLRRASSGGGFDLGRKRVTLATPFQQPLQVEQKGSAGKVSMHNLGTTPLRAVVRGRSLSLVTADARNWFGDKVLSSARFIQLDLAANPYKVVVDRVFGGQSTIHDQPTDRVHYGFPVVDVNAAGNAVIAYGRSSATHYPEVSFSVYPKAGPDILASRRLREGTGPAGSGGDIQLYDYNGAAVDPYDDTAVWFAVPFGRPNGGANYAIAVGRAYGKPTADLTIVPQPGLRPLQLKRGQPFTETLEHANHGDANAVHVKVALSLVTVGGAVISLGQHSFPSLQRDEVVKVIHTLTIPTRIAPGNYKLRAQIDSASTVTEYSEDNNRFERPVVVE
jgi:hypothetical protein